MLRQVIGKGVDPKKTFAMYRVDAPYKPITSHGRGKKMGGGKGSIETYGTPIRAGRIILEVGRLLELTNLVISRSLLPLPQVVVLTGRR